MSLVCLGWTEMEIASQAFSSNISAWSFPITAWLCPVHKARSIKTCLDEFGEFGMNWNGDCEPGFLIQTHKCSSKMGRNSHKNTSKSCGKPSQKSGSCYSCKEGTNFIVMSMCLECNVIKVLVGVMVKCPNTFVHLVCLYMERFFLMVLHTLQLCLV